MMPLDGAPGVALPPGSAPVPLTDTVALSPAQAGEEMSDEDLLTAITDEVSWAGTARDMRTSAGREALDYFYGRLPGPPTGSEADCGMSDLVSTDVQDAVYAVCAEIMPAFGGGAPVEFQALEEGDEQQAELETRATNHVAQSAGVYLALAQAVQDAMLRRVGVVKVYWEERVQVSYEQLDQVPLQALPQLLADQPGQTTEIIDASLDEQTGTASATLRRHRKRSRPRIDAVPLDEFLISDDLSAPLVEEARFVAHQRTATRSELIELGVDPGTVEALDSASGWNWIRARDGYTDRQRSAHPSTEPVVCVEAYYLIDWDGDGIAERRRILTAGGAQGTDTLLLNEPWADQPFAAGVGYLGVFSWDGVSLFDRLKSVQDAKTSLLRDVVNTARRNMRQRLGAIENDANINDLLTSAMGGIVRMKTPQAILPIPDVQMPQSAFSTLEYLDTVRKDKGGGAIDATASATVLGQGGDWSLERLMAATEQLNAMVAKNLVETLVKPLYCKLHRLLREYQVNPIRVPGSAGWASTLPAQWTPREDMVTTMGMSVGERTQRLGALQGVMAQQAGDLQAGMVGVLSDAQGAYRARIDMARLAGLPQPEQYFVDPASPQAQQAQQAAQQAQQAAQAAMQQEKVLTAEFQYRLMTDMEKIKADARIAAQDMQEQTRKLQAQLTAVNALLGHQVKLAELEQKGDLAEAQRSIDQLQFDSQADRARQEHALAWAKLDQDAIAATAKQGTRPPTAVKQAEPDLSGPPSGLPPPPAPAGPPPELAGPGGPPSPPQPPRP